MPISGSKNGDPDTVGNLQVLIENRDDLLAKWDRKTPSWKEVVLDIDNDQSIGHN
jgi:hypothetical protein